MRALLYISPISKQRVFSLAGIVSLQKGRASDARTRVRRHRRRTWLWSHQLQNRSARRRRSEQRLRQVRSLSQRELSFLQVRQGKHHRNFQEWGMGYARNRPGNSGTRSRSLYREICCEIALLFSLRGNRIEYKLVEWRCVWCCRGWDRINASDSRCISSRMRSSCTKRCWTSRCPVWFMAGINSIPWI